LFRLCTSCRRTLQILVAFLAICASAFCFIKWRAASTHLWKLYGWFAAIMCTACICTFFKVASLITATQFISSIPGYRASVPHLNSTLPEQMYSDLSWHQRWFAAFSFWCAFEFTFMSFAELLVLHRYLDLAFQRLSVTAKNSALNRRCKACAYLAICFCILDIMSSSASMYYRLQTSVDDSPAWYLSNRRADYATAAQVLSEVCALAIKAALFAFICRLDLQRIAKIEGMTSAHLLQVCLKRVLRKAHFVLPRDSIDSVIFSSGAWRGQPKASSAYSPQDHHHNLLHPLHTPPPTCIRCLRVLRCSL
jgi:hypothetical protein